MSAQRCIGLLLVAASASLAGTAAWAAKHPSFAPRAAAALNKPYAQGLVDRMQYLNPQILRLDLITTPPGKSSALIVASTVPAAVGQPDPQPASAPNAAPECHESQDSRGYRCVLSMRDTPGSVIGKVSITLPYYPGQDTNRSAQLAVAVRDQLAETTPGLQTLFEEMNISPSKGDPHAQCMILDVLAHHPDLMVLAMHVTPPGETVNKMLSINERRFLGKTSEEVEQKLATNRGVLLESFANTHRLETHVPIFAADGAQVGTMATVYFWHTEDEMPGLLAKTFAIQQELKPLIHDLNSLYEPCKQFGTEEGAVR